MAYKALSRGMGEYTMTLPNRKEAEAFVSALYLGVLRRKPDEAGHAQFVNSLLRGRTYASVAEEFVTCEEFKAQSAVKLFVPPGHFYSPIVDPVEADRHLAALEAVTTPESIRGINIDRRGMIETWRSLLPFLTSIPSTTLSIIHFIPSETEVCCMQFFSITALSVS